MPARTVAFARNHYYHLYNRGAARQPIFREPDNYLYALRLLKKYARQTETAIIAYCLMPNHYHLLVRQDGDVPARFLPQRIFNAYTKAYNKRFACSGTLFQGRFQARHVDREDYLLHLCRYIHANPVKDGLVSSAADWPYSNYLDWIGERHGTLLDRAFIAAHFPDTACYAEFVVSYLHHLAALPADIRSFLGELD